MAKAKNSEMDNSELELPALLSDKEFDKIASEEKVKIVISGGKHTKHLKEGSVHEVPGALAAELIDSGKATLK